MYSIDNEIRATVDTATAAFHLNRQPQTLRAWACLETGPIRPLRIQGRLAWPVADIRQLVGRTNLRDLASRGAHPGGGSPLTGERQSIKHASRQVAKSKSQMEQSRSARFSPMTTDGTQQPYLTGPTGDKELDSLLSSLG